ncbi:MAG: cadherin-like beta sandwich domain-containing protein, partial [Gammaproteobacteria bacterium]|nr:cadherin-like beta sandwich domain-containing protein [Gammaproteobacteria bacterium]
ITDPTEIDGFTLTTANADILADKSGNSLDLTGTTPIDTANTAIAYRDTTLPRITVKAGMATAGANDSYTMSFEVEADELVATLGNTGSYELRRVDNNNDLQNDANAMAGNPMETTANRKYTIGYTADLSGLDKIQIRNTKGFTLVRVGTSSLIDNSGNPPARDSGNNAEIDVGERIDSDDNAVALRDSAAPKITVTALSTEATPARDAVDNTINTYTMQFRVNSNKAVADIGDPMAYTLMRIPSGGGTAVAITTTGNRDSGEVSQTEATITFIGQFTAAEITNEQDTVAFTLGRATDADTGRCRLCSLESSQPTRGGGSSGTGAIAAGERIDENDATTQVSRDRTAPQIAVESDGNLEQPTGSDIGGVTSGIQADGAFHVRFKLEGDYSDIPDIVDALTPGFQSGFRVLRKHSGSNTFSVVNRRGQFAQAVLPVVSACREVQGVNLVTIPDCYHIGVGDAILSASDAANTEYFTLGRGSGRLRDGSNNEPVVFGTNMVVRAVGDAAGPLPLNTTPTANLILERNKPWLTVEASEFARIGDQICGSFEVSGRDSNSNSEPIDGINEAGSYRLLSIDSDGNVSELTTAGSANERCEGDGSVISRVTPEVTNIVPNPSLLTATIYFNVMDVGVTTQHKYTLGRQAKLTDISGNALVDNAARTTEITTTADATGRIDSRSAALGDIPSGDTTNPIITATVQDTDGNTADMVEAIPDENDPLSFSGRFRVEVEQPDDGEENVPNIGKASSYQVVYVSISRNREEEIADQTITTSSVTVNRAATVDFVATLPNLAAVQDVAGFRLKPVNLVDSGGNTPLNNEFTDTNPEEEVDSTVARRDTTAPAIKVVADSGAVAQADDGTQYQMTFTVSVVGTPEDVRNLDDASAYRLMRIGGGSPFDLNVDEVTKDSSSNKRSATFTYTATVSSGIEDITGFTLARASAADSLIDRSGNAPVRGGTTDKGTDILDDTRIDNDDGAVALRETTPPQITITAVNQTATADANDSYTMTFTVSSGNQDVETLGDASSYELRRITNNDDLEDDANAMADSPMQVTLNREYTISYTADLSSLGAAEIRNTKGFTLVRVGTSSLIDSSGNLPVKGGTANNGAAIADNARIDDDDTAIAARDSTPPQIEVRPVGAGAVAHASKENTFTGQFTVRSVSGGGIGEPIKGLGLPDNYALLRKAIGVGGDIDTLPATITSTDDDATTKVTIEFEVTFAGTDTEIAEAIRTTDGFTLGAGSLDMYDYASNLPIGVDDAIDDILDSVDEALALRDKQPPAITVAATDIQPSNGGKTYTLSFKVKSDEPVQSIGENASYTLLPISSGAVSFSDIDVSADANEANTTATVTVTATIDDYADVRMITGFTLARATDALRDKDGNDPVKGGTTNKEGAIADGARIDDDATAVAERDTTAPTLTVAAVSDAIADDDNGNKYTVRFTVESDKPIDDIAKIGSYKLTHEATNSADVIPDLTDLINTSATMTLNDVTTVEYTLTFSSLAQTRATTGFALTRVADRLLDASGNLPQIGGEDIAAGGELATAARDSTPPKFNVIGQTPTLVTAGDPTQGFNIVFKATPASPDTSATIRKFNEPGSYTLLQLARAGATTGTAVAGVTPAVTVDGDTHIATITYSGVMAPASLYGFSLGRSNDDVAEECNLCDESNNAPVENEQALDSDATAVVVLPDRIPPRIEVEAVTDAMPDDDNGNIYTMTFKVTADEVVTKIGDAGTYLLKRIDKDDNMSENLSVSPVDIKGDTDGRVTTLTYTTSAFDPAVTQDTTGFTLVFVAGSGNLEDSEGNAPQNRDMNDLVDGERIDPRTTAVAARDTMAPAITVRPTAATATVGDSYTYSGSFTVSAEEDIRDIAVAESYQLLRILSGIEEVMPDATLTPPADGSTARQATIGFEVMLADAATARATLGFTLQRNSAGGLRDFSNNDATINTTDTAARILRDTTAPTLTVADADATIKPDDDDGNKYKVSFTITSNETVADIAEITSYKLTHKATNSADVIADLTTIFDGNPTITAVTGGAKVDYTLTFGSLTDTRATTGFALTRVADKLLDADGNLPQVGGVEVADGGELAMVARDSAAPKFDVTAAVPTLVDENDASKGYKVVFTAQPVSSGDTSETIRGFGKGGSYTLLQLASSGATGEAVSDVTTATVIVDTNTHIATITYSGVTVTPYGFNLGRNAGECNLCDLSNNAPIEFVADTTVGNGKALDSGAEVELPDLIPPTITVRPTDGNEIATVGDSYAYSGSFTVSALEDILNIAKADSYQLLRIYIMDATEVTEVMSDAEITTATVSARQATIGFSVKLVDADTALATVGFTLQRNPAGSLQDLANNEAVIDITDTAARVLIDKMPPAITVEAASPVPSNAGKTYSLSFDVSSNDDPVPSIGENDSYALLHLVNDVNPPADLSSFDASATANAANTTATVTFEVTIADVDVLRTTGFTLARAVDALRDRDGNHPVKGGDMNEGDAIGDDARIDDDTTAVAARDAVSPQITVTAGMATADANDSYTMTFTVSSGNQDVETLGDASSYELRRITNNDDLEDDANAMADSPMQVTLNREYTISYTADLSSLGAAEIRNTKGFTLVRVGTDSLIDSSGNQPVRSGDTTAIADDAVIDDTAIAARETDRPQIEVRPVLVNGFGTVAHDTKENTFTGQFTVRSVSGGDVGEPIKGLGAIGNYSLLRKVIGSDDFPPQPSAMITSTKPNTTTSTTIGFEVTFTGTADEIAEAIRTTDGFTLGAGTLDLIDYASNLPMGVEVINDRLDSDPESLAVIEKVGPVITVEATSIVPSNAGKTYTLLFDVSSDIVVRSIDEADSYLLLHLVDEDSGDPIDFSSITPSVTPRGANPTTATVTYEVTINDYADVRRTIGFTLARATTSGALEDGDGNDPLREDRSSVGANQRIDNNDSAIALRDRTPPQITVEASGNLTAEANGYGMAFEVSANDVPISELSDNTSVPYSLLRKLKNGDYQVVGLSGTVTVSETAGVVTVRYADVPLLLLADARATEAFTLGRVAERLLDTSGNNPAVEIEDTLQAVTANPPLPLDASAAASFTTVRAGPEITVMAGGKADKSADVYSGSFNVMSNVAVKGINNTTPSYVLLRVSQAGEAVLLPDAELMLSEKKEDLKNVTVEFSVEDSSAVNTDSYTLGRTADGLTDLLGNLPIDPVTKAEITTATVATQRLDSRNAALVVIEVIITVEANAVDGKRVKAIPDDDDPNMYTGSFNVMSNTAVSGIAEMGSYKLLRKALDGSYTVPSNVTISPAMGAERQTTVSFSVTLGSSIATTNTAGFTLGYLANLEHQNEPPLTYETAMLLDESDEALADRDTDAPQIIVTAGNSGVATVTANNADSITYSVEFSIEAQDTSTDAAEEVRNIDTAASYKLLRIPEGTDGSPVVLSGGTIKVAANAAGTTATIAYSGVQINRAVADMTESFALARGSDDALQDLAGNNPVSPADLTDEIADGEQFSDVDEAKATLPPSNTATLSDLELTDRGNSITLSQSFDSEVLTYTANVRYSAESIQVTPTASDNDAMGISITVNGTAVASGVASGGSTDVTLNADKTDTTVITVVVTAEDGTVGSSYVVTVSYLAASNDATLTSLELTNITFDFDSATRSYDLRVPHSTTSTRVTATQALGATITGFEVDDTAVDIANIANAIKLKVGVTKIKIDVTAEDGLTPGSYTVNITREPAGIRIRAKVFLEGPLQ